MRLSLDFSGDDNLTIPADPDFCCAYLLMEWVVVGTMENLLDSSGFYIDDLFMFCIGFGVNLVLTCFVSFCGKFLSVIQKVLILEILT